MKHLIPSIPITGPAPETNYGSAYRTVAEIASLLDEILEEVWFDGIETDVEGGVHLTLEGERVALARMDGPHADSRLSIEDPE